MYSRRRFETILVTDNRDGILTITLNRPSTKNAWNNTMYTECAQVINDSAKDDEILAIVISGGEETDHFSSGIIHL